MPLAPAARVGDPHVCPLFEGPKPHVGGPVLPPGQANFLIEGMPAARMGDKLLCIGPPDMFVSGSPKVLIGGMPAARVTDMLAHGGKVVKGAIRTFIGEGPPEIVECRDCMKAAADSGSATVS